MCGIGFLASFNCCTNGIDKDRPLITDWNKRLSESLASRGPDVPSQQYQFSNSDTNLVDCRDSASVDLPIKKWCVTLHASVLHMRGNEATKQPVLFPASSSEGDDAQKTCALCWNGECYTYFDNAGNVDDGTTTQTAPKATTKNINQSIEHYGRMIELVSIIEEESDTVLVTKLLKEAITRSPLESNTDEHEAIANAMSRIHGEYSFIFFVPSTSTNGIESNNLSNHRGYMYYGRDHLGRRSLLSNKSVDGAVAVSSVAICGDANNNSNKGWEELPPGIVYRLDVCTGEETCIPIPRVVNKDAIGIAMIAANPSLSDPTEVSTNTQSESQIRNEAADHLLKFLDRAVKRRVMHAPTPKSQSATDASVAVLFSGGIDSVILAALSHRHVPLDQSIDLINVSFFKDANPGMNAAASPDRLAAILSYHEMLSRFPDRKWRFIAVDVPYEEVLEQEQHIKRLISPLDSTMDFNISAAFWFAARGRGRVLGMDEVEEARRGLENMAGINNTDNNTTQPLLRFASGKSADNKKVVPKSRSECIRVGCTRLAPQSGCVFKACKVCCGKLQGPISKYLGQRAMICPAHNHDVDKKKGSGRHKSSQNKKKASVDRGKKENDNSVIVPSTAKILLSGVGADEQMAGYGRHRTTFQRDGYESLHAELEMEVSRLWTRNLGRDDRCLSDHGKEARFPYLDEDVMAYLKALPVEIKCDMTLPLGEGDKQILRKVARTVGVLECSTLVKRAIQFGSRIAKVSDKSRFGSCRQATGQSKIVSDRGNAGEEEKM